MGALSLVVTGAAGFLGRAVCAEAAARGHRPRGVVRRPGQGGDAVCDLAEGVPPALLAGADAVIHCAGALAGDAARMERDTVAATRALMAAARAAGVPVVLAGSMAVYAGRPGAVIDEDSPLEPEPEARDAYTRAKLAQEAVARAAGVPLRIMRLGALWGPGRLWNAHLGPRLGPVLFLVGRGPIPLAHVSHAASALLSAAEGRWEGTEVINVLDDDLPDARRFLAALPDPPRLVLPLPFALLDRAAGLLAPLGAGGRLPGLLRRPVLHARMAPRRYSTARLHALGWRPRLDFAQGMAEARR